MFRITNRFLASVALIAAVLTSVLVICSKQVAMAYGPMSGQNAAMEGKMSDCMQTSCQTSVVEHLSLFSQAHPFSAVNVIAFLLALSALLISAFPRLRSLESSIADEGRLRVMLRSLSDCLNRSLTAPFLVLAFQRGILHAKRYA